MAQLNELLKSDFLKNPTVRNTAIGIGVAILLPIVAKAAAPYVRPVARSALKIGIVAYEKGREAVAEAGEIIEDMVAEVREELRQQRAEAQTALDEVASGIEEAAEKVREEVERSQSA
jgi:hypothetical protein